MSKNINIEELIKKTDALTYVNALKTGLSELKDEMSSITEMQEYQAQAVERARRIIRRMDNQYRAVVKAAHGQPLRSEAEINEELKDFMESS